MITIGIIEDDRSLRKNLEIFINMQSDLLTAFSYNSIEEFLKESNSLEEPFIILVDLGLPGISGLEGISLIRKRWDDVHIVVITGNDDENVILDCIQRGANGYILKPFNISDFVKNIEIIRDGGGLITPAVANKLFKRLQKLQDTYLDVAEALTTREKDVVNELMKGLTYKEIGNVLEISTTTVNGHLKNIYSKMGVRNKSELISKLLRKY